MTTPRRVMERGAQRFDVLLLAVVLPLLVAPLERVGIRPVLGLLLAAVFLFALWTSGVSNRVLATAAVLAAVGVAASTITQFTGGQGSRAVFAAVNALLCVATIAAILVRSQQRFRVNGRTVSAALSIYLLIGLLFSYLYELLDSTQGTAFFTQPGHHNPVSFLYFSIITLTTVGYGDLNPGTDGGRMLAALEALLGQLYLVTVVAVVVGSRVRGSGSHDDDRKDD